MNLNESLTNLEAVCINLDIRKDKRKWMKVQCKRKNLKIKYHTATLNDNPKRGCLPGAKSPPKRDELQPIQGRPPDRKNQSPPKEGTFEKRGF